jgi:hypothetical protein
MLGANRVPSDTSAPLSSPHPPPLCGARLERALGSKRGFTLGFPTLGGGGDSQVSRALALALAHSRTPTTVLQYIST